jgi:transcriptional regulator of acetoin/glycerol metabolism
VERAVLFCCASEITCKDLPDHAGTREPSRRSYEIPPFLSLQEIEREAIAQTLARTGGNIKKAAQILRVHRPTFYRKLRRFGLLGSQGHGNQ